jgi:hypothetical protein
MSPKKARFPMRDFGELVFCHKVAIFLKISDFFAKSPLFGFGSERWS